jgi:hypothetical protein
LVGLRRLLPAGRRKRRAPRAEAPRTIVPQREPAASSDSSPAQRFDAARERLRAQIPPPADDE